MPKISGSKEKLIASALDLFYQRSYVDVGVQALCKRAGVKKGNFYYYFDSKRELLLQALDRHAQELMAALSPAFELSLPPSRRIKSLFERIYVEQKSYHKKTGQVPGCFFGNMALELSTHDELIRKRLSKILSQLVERIERTFQELVDDGTLADIDTHASAQAVLAYVEGVILLAKLGNDPELILHLARGAEPFAITHHQNPMDLQDAI